MLTDFEYPAPTIALSETSLAQSGAVVVATLAYPQIKDLHLRMKTFARLIGRRYVDGAEWADNWFQTADSATVMLPLDRRELDGGRTSLDRRIRRRLDVGQLALEPLHAAARGAPLLRRWGEGWNRADATRRLNSEIGIPDARNFERRWWAKSLAVIHIAAAWAGMLHADSQPGEPRALVDRLLTDRAYLRQLIREARIMESLVEAAALGIPGDLLIKFRMEN